MLTLIATLGTSNQFITSHGYLKFLLIVELIILLFTIVTGVVALIRQSEVKTTLAIITAFGLIIGVALMAYISAIALLG